VGNHYQGFERLVAAADRLAGQGTEEFIAQTGTSNLVPRHMRYEKYFSTSQAQAFIRQARLVIAHAGIGTIITAQKDGTPLILVPRRKKHGEHNNDHQMEIVTMLQQEKRAGISIADPLENLEDCVTAVLQKDGFKTPAAGAGKERVKEAIDNFLFKNRKE
jgi:UDP-N-acetylglucosamine transferase subunit ALG13